MIVILPPLASFSAISSTARRTFAEILLGLAGAGGRSVVDEGRQRRCPASARRNVDDRLGELVGVSRAWIGSLGRRGDVAQNTEKVGQSVC